MILFFFERILIRGSTIISEIKLEKKLPISSTAHAVFVDISSCVYSGARILFITNISINVDAPNTKLAFEVS